MKQLLKLFLCSFFILSISFCKKAENLATTHFISSLPPIPNVAGAGVTYGRPVFLNVFGVLATITTRGYYTDSASNTPIYSNSASATFLNENGQCTAGHVSINSFQLDTSTTYQFLSSLFYFNKGTTLSDTLSFINNNKWVVSGGNNISGFTFDYTGNFPKFSGTLPANADLNNDISITFDASNSQDADSAFFAIIASNTSGSYETFQSNVVGTHSGNATISGPMLQYAVWTSAPPRPAYIEVFLLKSAIKTFGEKQFAFIKVDQFVQPITLF